MTPFGSNPIAGAFSDIIHWVDGTTIYYNERVDFIILIYVQADLDQQLILPN